MLLEEKSINFIDRVRLAQTLEFTLPATANSFSCYYFSLFEIWDNEFQEIKLKVIGELLLLGVIKSWKCVMPLTKSSTRGLLNPSTQDRLN